MKIGQRIYNDFLRPSKEKEYELILRTANERGYEFHTILSFEDVIKEGVDPQKKYLILRRDIDTADFGILRKMLLIEQKYGARATYYFRWTTMNVQLMKEITEVGGEASYHFEELATFCYHHRIRHKECVLQRMEEIKAIFLSNIEKFRVKTGQPCLTISSHGDYVNTKLNLRNIVLIDERVRKESGIIREAYDTEHMNALTYRIADQTELESFTEKALAAIEKGEQVLELLTHPRQWNSPIWINLKENFIRVIKGLYMNL